MNRVAAASSVFPSASCPLPSALLLWVVVWLLLSPVRASCGGFALPPASTQTPNYEKVTRWLRQLEPPAVFFSQLGETNITSSANPPQTSHKASADIPPVSPLRETPPISGNLLPSVSPKIAKLGVDSAGKPLVTHLLNRVAGPLTLHAKKEFYRAPPSNGGRKPAAVETPLSAPVVHHLNAQHQSFAGHSEASRINAVRQRIVAAGPPLADGAKAGHRFSAADFKLPDSGFGGHPSSVAGPATSDGARAGRVSGDTPAAAGGARIEHGHFVPGLDAYDGAVSRNRHFFVESARKGYASPGIGRQNEVLSDDGAAAGKLPRASILSPEHLANLMADKGRRQRTRRGMMREPQSNNRDSVSVAKYDWPFLTPLQAPILGGHTPGLALGTPSGASPPSSNVALPKLEPYLLSFAKGPYPVGEHNLGKIPRVGGNSGQGYPSHSKQPRSHLNFLRKVQPDSLISTASGGDREYRRSSKHAGGSSVDQQPVPSSTPLLWSMSDTLWGLAPPLTTEASATATKEKATIGAGNAILTPRKEQHRRSWVSTKFLDELPATAAKSMFFSPPVNTPGSTQVASRARADEKTAINAAAATAATASTHTSVALPSQQPTSQASDVLSMEAGSAAGGQGSTATVGNVKDALGYGRENKYPVLPVHQFPMSYTTITRSTAPHYLRALEEMISRLSHKQEDPVVRQQESATISSATEDSGLAERTGVLAERSVVEDRRAPVNQQQHAKAPPPTTSTVDTLQQKKVGENVGPQEITVNDHPVKDGKRKQQAESPDNAGEDGMMHQEVKSSGETRSRPAAMIGIQRDEGNFKLAASLGGHPVLFPFSFKQTLLPGFYHKHLARAQAAPHPLHPLWLPRRQAENPRNVVGAVIQEQEQPSLDAASIQLEAASQYKLHMRSRDTGARDSQSSYSESTTRGENTYSMTGSTTDTMHMADETSDATGAPRYPTLQRKDQEPVDAQKDPFARQDKVKKHKATAGAQKDKEGEFAKGKKQKRKKRGKVVRKRKAVQRYRAASKDNHHIHYREPPDRPFPSPPKQKRHAEAAVAPEKRIVTDDGSRLVQGGALPLNVPYHLPPARPYQYVHPISRRVPAAGEAPSPAPSPVPGEKDSAGTQEKQPAGPAAEVKADLGKAATAASSLVVERSVRSRTSTGRHALDGQFLVSTTKERLDQELGVRRRLDRPDLVQAAWKALKAVTLTASSSGRLLYLRLTRRLPWSWDRYVKELPAVDDTMIPEFRTVRRQLEHKNSEVLIVDTPSAALRHIVATEHPGAVMTHGLVIKGRVIDARHTARCVSEVNGLMKIVPKSPFVLVAYGAWVSRPDAYSAKSVLAGEHKGRGGRKKDGGGYHRIHKKQKKYRKPKSDPLILYVVTARARGDVHDYIHGKGNPFDVEMAAAEMLYSVHLLHDAGFLHRDVKLMNFLVNFDGHVVLADFDGVWPVGVPVSTKDFLLYTKGYLSPEVDINKPLAKYTVKSDIYALGVCLKELHEAKPDMPNATLFKQLYKRMTAMSPEKRPSTVEAMQHPFFKNVNFSSLEQLKHPPPFPGDFAIDAGFYG